MRLGAILSVQNYELFLTCDFNGRLNLKTALHANSCFKWSKEFMEAGKRRLRGDTIREATRDELVSLKIENVDLKREVANLRNVISFQAQFRR